MKDFVLHYRRPADATRDGTKDAVCFMDPRIQGTQLLLIADDFRVDGGSVWLDKRLVASTRNLTSITCNDEQVWTP